MPALRQPVKRTRFWIISIAAAALAAAAIFDWTRPAPQQMSPYLFERGIVLPYRVVVRPVTSGFIRCRFRPTCSAYAVQAMRVHGFPKGAWFATKRLFRCTPWVRYGTYDPVPPKK